MNNYNLGKDYEDFVETVYMSILEAEKRNGQIGHITLERRKKIKSKSGTPAEIDIYWEYKLAGVTNSVAIECRNYNKNVDIPGVRDFARKISDISGLKGLIVTKKGFSKNAIDEANADNIDLLIIREHTKEDWEGRIQSIDMHFIIQPPIEIISIQPNLNNTWLIDNGYTAGSQLKFNMRSDQLVFEDKSINFKYSLHELVKNKFFEEKTAGKHQWRKLFVDGWMNVGDTAYKLDELVIDYIKPDVIQDEIHLNFEDYVLAIMEYINSDNKKIIILKNGEKKEY